MIRFLWNLFASLLFGRNQRVPKFVARPARLLHEKGLVLSTALIGRPGVGKTYALAVELIALMEAHPEQSFFVFDWSGGLITILLLLVLSSPNRWHLLPRIVYDAMGGRKI